jgi:hypothetical protein
MLRKTVFIGTIIGMVLSMISTATVAHAQTQYPLPAELPVVGEIPTWPAGTFGYFANDDFGTTWFITPEVVWSFSPDSLKWTRWPSVQLDDVEVRLGYDKANDRFLFWNGGVGKVFTWKPGDTTAERIDKSFHHRTQFGHAWFIHPDSGEIYAFGGYGFWQSRGYTARFDLKGMEWLVLPLDSTKPYPSPRAGAKHTYDAKRNQFHIFGGHNYRNEGREDLSVDFVDFDDYWILDIETREWKSKPVFGFDGAFELNKEIRRNNEIFYFAVEDQENDLAWYPARSSVGSNDIRLLVFDYSREFGAYTPISLGDLGNKSNIQWFSYNSKSNQLIIYWFQAASSGNTRPIRVSALPLPHPDSTRAMMDLVREYGSIHPPAKASSSWTWLLLLIPAVVVGGWVWQRRKSQLSEGQVVNESEPTTHPKTELTFCLIGQPRLLLNGTEVRNHFSEPEFGLLIWLYWKHRNGESFQITDVIENVFWHDSPNMDYIRKQRNTTLRRLNEQLEAIFGEHAPDHEWIVDKVSISDKRKREYALDLNGLSVKCDLDTIQSDQIDPTALLESCNGIWAEHIRNDYLTMSTAS